MERTLGMALAAVTWWVWALAAWLLLTGRSRRSAERLSWGVAVAAVMFLSAPAALLLLYEP